MNKDDLKKNLVGFGLNEDEAILYLFLFEKGPKTPLEISRESKINRSKIYRLIETMAEKKLIEEIETSRGIRIKAAKAENFEALIENEEQGLKAKKELLPQIINSFIQLPNTPNTKFEIKHYKGVEGIKEIVWNTLKTKELIIISSTRDIKELVGEKFIDLIMSEYEIREILIKEKSNSKEKEMPKELREHYKYNFIPEEKLKIRHQMFVYGDTVAILNWWDGEVAGIEIINKPFAEMQKDTFNIF